MAADFIEIPMDGKRRRRIEEFQWFLIELSVLCNMIKCSRVSKEMRYWKGKKKASSSQIKNMGRRGWNCTHHRVQINMSWTGMNHTHTHTQSKTNDRACIFQKCAKSEPSRKELCNVGPSVSESLVRLNQNLILFLCPQIFLQEVGGFYFQEINSSPPKKQRRARLI